MENGADAKMDMTLGSTTYYIAQENDFDAVGDTYFPASPTGPGTYIDANYGGFTNVSPAANGTITITCKKFIDNPQVNDGIGVPGVQLIQQSGPAFPPNTTPVAITRQPFNRRAAVGSSTVAFDVVATGPVSSYYWYRNGSLIPGATGSSYAPLVGAGDNGAHYS